MNPYMNPRMLAFRTIWSKHFRDRYFTSSLFLSFGILICALIVNFYAIGYATRVASSSVTDLILSNIPVYNVDAIFIYGPWIMWLFVLIITLSKPYRMPFIVKSIALFVGIRSVFITLTHIGPFPNEVVMYSSRFINNFSSGGDLFFSAHTGLPFLMALIFWDTPLLRYGFIVTSIFFGVVVLLGHLHYSIDVLSAFFITYSIYIIATRIFPKDFALFPKGIQDIL